MKILIAGGTGFIGTALANHLLQKQDHVTILGRDATRIKKSFAGNVAAITWQEFRQQGSEILQDIDLVINLAGANVGDQSWTPERKVEIVNSRVTTTQFIAEQCAKVANPPALFNASGIGIYGTQAISDTLPKPFTEDDTIQKDPSDFMIEVASKWEAATQIAKDAGVRVVNMRFAGVLGDQGLLKKMHLPFSLGLGGPVGSGRQPFSWIALTDLIRAIDFLIENSAIKGAVNFVAPQCITQKQFAKALAQSYHRPSVIVTPALVVKLLFGEMGETLILNGQCAYPKILIDNGFIFNYTDINTILEDLQKR